MQTPRHALTLGPTGWLLLLALSLLWGGTFLLVEIALVDLPPLTIVLARVGLAALTLQLVVPLLGYRMPLDARIWAAFLVMGMLNNAVPFSLLFWGQTELTSGLTALLTVRRETSG